MIPTTFRRVAQRLAPFMKSPVKSWIDDKTGNQEKTIQVSCQPEKKLPKHSDKKAKAADFDIKMDLNPFGHIRRSAHVNEFNCEVIHVTSKTINQADMKELASDDYTPSVQVNSFSASVPFIVNPEKINAGVELVLKWEKTEQSKEKAEKPALNAFDQLQQNLRKETKAGNKP